jgi:proteasome lid subunit RPN8/RPN11
MPQTRERYLSMDCSPARVIRSAPETTPHRARAARHDFGRERFRIVASCSECRGSRRLSSTGIRLDSGVYQELVRIFQSSTQLDGYESGGLLFAPRANERLIELLAASGPGPNARRTRDLFAHDPDHNRQVAAEMVERGLVPCGEHHVHPNGWGSLSAADLRAHSAPS